MNYIHYSSQPKPSVGFGGFGSKDVIVWSEDLSIPEKENIKWLVAGYVNLIKWDKASFRTKPTGGKK